MPRTADVCGAVSGPLMSRAIPKSITRTLPSRVIITFAGLMSRWITPWACAAPSASAISCAIVAACFGGSVLPDPRKSASVRPSMYCITM